MGSRITGWAAAAVVLASERLAVRVSSPTTESELHAPVDDAMEHSAVRQAIGSNVAVAGAA
jgi:hypothetical protein